MTRTSQLDDVGDRDAAPGSKPWSVFMLRQAKFNAKKLDSDAEILAMFIENLKKHEGWKALGFLSLEVMCERELHLSARDVLAVTKAKRDESLKLVLERGKADQPDKNMEDWIDEMQSAVRPFFKSWPAQQLDVIPDVLRALIKEAEKYPALRVGG
jgi:hypothetical protein